MKSTLSRAAISISIVLSLFVISCGKKNTPDSLSDELVTQVEELTSAIESAKDKESAEKAAIKINKLADKQVEIFAQLKALDLSAADEKLIEEKISKAETDNEQRTMAAMRSIMGNPEVRAIIMQSMAEFGKKMESAEGAQEE